MTTSTSIFKFATIRNANDQTTALPGLEIQPATAFVKSLVAIIESDKEQSEKIKSINRKLEAFIQSDSFFKTKVETVEAVSKISADSAEAADSKKTTAKKEAAADLKKLYENLYDNIVVRTITKSTTNEIFKLLAESLRTLHGQLNREGVSGPGVEKPRIIFPERLVLSFSPPKATAAPAETAVEQERAALFAQIDDLTEQQRQLQKAKGRNASQMAAEHKKILEQQIKEDNLLIKQIEAARKRGARDKEPEINLPPRRAEASPALTKLEAEAREIKSAEKELDLKLTELSRRAFRLLPRVNYALVGEKWVDVSQLEKTRPQAVIEEDTIVVYSHGCRLKFPFQVADLRVIEQQTVGYVPGEIAHINNTQQGELHEKQTRRLKRVETFESLITEDETFRETDTQSTEKFGIEKAASEVQAEETSINVNASVSGTYGVVTASVDAGYSYSQSSQNANSTAQSYAREIVGRVVDRVSNKVRKERSLKTLEEFEETVRHVVDNTKATEPKSYVYRWLTKLSRATLKNYGKRLIFQIDIAHPSQYYLSRSIKDQPMLSIHPDPREMLDASGRRIFTVDDISRGNYLAIAEYFDTTLEQPPEQTIIVSYGNSGSAGAQSQKESITIPDGYKAVKAHIKSNTGSGGSPAKWNYLSVLVGRTANDRWVLGNPTVSLLHVHILDGETKSLPVTIFTPFGEGYSLNIEVECELEPRAFLAWQIKCYNACLEAYDNQKAAAENKMSEWDVNSPGLHPLKKKELIRTELKKGALSKIFRCNPFWITDNYEVGKEYDPDCCKDSLNAEKVRFLETLFDWNNMTYELYPYLYADKDNWAGLLGVSDDDPHFEAFLQASFATVRIPVHRDSLKEITAINFIMTNSTANHEVIPESVMALLDDLNSATPFKTDKDGKLVYEFDKDGNRVPFYSRDLGIFPVPTDLVILECGVENGIKPIGFPQTEVEGTSVSIPKQYSPAIIADRCAVTAVTPGDAGPDDVGPDDVGPADLDPKDSTL